MIEKNAPELLEYYANKCPSNAQDFYKNLYKALKKISKKAYQQRNYKVNQALLMEWSPPISCATVGR